MSTELPDFDQHVWWLDSEGSVWNCPFQTDEMSRELKLELAPWAPLETAEEWVQRIDREKAKIIGWVAYRSGGDLDDVVDAVLDALPELMKGESDE